MKRASTARKGEIAMKRIKQIAKYAAYMMTVVIVLSMSFEAAAFDSTMSNAARVMAESAQMTLNSNSACLIEPSTGQVLYEYNADERYEPASVTKVMTLLLIMEALDDGTISLTDTVTASMYAASMGGSQIWLEYGEQLPVDEMLIAIVGVSANACSVAMAEHLAGSEENFVARMNERAAELGMVNTTFKNCTGLPVEGHLTTARDIALMTCELLKHEKIFDYTTIWMDSLRGGAMGLSNTNKLIRFYPGATGMKTGYTSSAGYCLSATAARDGMSLVATMMKAKTSAERFADAKKLLDYGFANYSVYKCDDTAVEPIAVKGGKEEYLNLSYGGCSVLLPKGREKKVETILELPEYVSAPINKGDVIGKAHFVIDKEEIATRDIVAAEGVERLGVFDIFDKIFKKLMLFR